MACYWPLKCYVGEQREADKINVVFKRRESFKGEALYLPCGQCVGCRLERSRQWAVRCMHEASLYEKNCFVTLTFEEGNLPKNGSLDVSYWQNFMKRLRKVYGSGIRYFHCGEYGDTFGRPHYHGLLFNHDFEDRKLFSEREGVRLYTSESLGKLWDKGFSTVGDVTFKSAGYVARYALKKVTGDDAEKHYGGRKPEYTTMSRRPGIGRKWFEKFKSDVFPSDEVVVNGVATKPPRFYDNLLDKNELAVVKDVRKKEGMRYVTDNIGGRVVLVSDSDSFRLPVREEVCKAKLKLLKRSLEV